MRPLPIEPLPDTPPFVLGLAVIRGMPVPVLDAARMLGAEAGPSARLVTMRAGERQIALAVDGVIGVRTIPHDELHALPPLLRESCSEVVTTIGSLDNELLLVLGDARVVSEEVWARLDVQERSP